MVMFHSYVSLPEGTTLLILPTIISCHHVMIESCQVAMGLKWFKPWYPCEHQNSWTNKTFIISQPPNMVVKWLWFWNVTGG